MRIFQLDKRFLLLLIAVSILFLAASFYYYRKTIQDDGSISLVDFRVYYYAGLNLEANENIYDSSDGEYIYKYSPVFALVMSVIRFSTITSAQALCLWYFILFIAFMLSLYLIKEILFYPQPYKRYGFFDIVPILFIFRYLVLTNFTKSYLPSECPLFIKIYDKFLYTALVFFLLTPLFVSKKRNEAKYLPILVLAVLFVLRFLLLNIDRAQVNIIILMLLSFFAYYLICKKEVISGIYLGIAMIFKLSPGIFLIYLVFKKRSKALFSSIATFTALLFIPSFKLGFGRNIELIKGWIDMLKMTLPAEYLQHKNQSLMAMVSRFFSCNSDVAVIPLGDMHVAGLVGVVYTVFIYLLVYCVMKKKPDAQEERQVAMDLSIFSSAMAILFPVGTKTAFIYLILPLALLIKEAFERQLKDRFINLGLITYAGLVYLSSSDIIGDFSLVLHKYSLMTFCLLIILGLTVYVEFTFRERFLRTIRD